MKEAEGVREQGAGDVGMEEMGTVLHELCQPLTTLQCRLEMAGVIGTAEGYREAVDQGLAECLRLVRAVESMREILRSTRHAGEVASRRSG
jgi:hypothetical protein